MKKNSFDKFIRKEEKGSKLKERIRQEKKKAREEKKAYFQQKRSSTQGRSPGAAKQDRYGSRPSASDGRVTGADPKRTARPSGASRSGPSGAARGSSSGVSRGNSPGASRGSSPGASANTSRGETTRPAFAKKYTRNPGGRADTTGMSGKTPLKQSPRENRVSTDQRAASKKQAGEKSRPGSSGSPGSHGKSASVKTLPAKKPAPGAKNPAPALMPLNKFIAHAGICSRRDAAEIVRSGKISVNGEAVVEPGFKVSNRDEVTMQGKKITAHGSYVYILLNKPKDHITTLEDPQGRKTVMSLISSATSERVYPVGRLDRNTTGVLLLTNDGELTQKLSHPSYQVRKIYEVTLDKPLTRADFDQLLNGITLDDGFISPDSLAYADSKNKSVIGIEIHSGRNRIVRRMFEKLGYDVRNLDRVMYANLTKKNVERGKWRFLQDKEVRLLKFMNSSYGRKREETR